MTVLSYVLCAALFIGSENIFKIMKKVYAKPEIQAIELKQQGCLLAGSKRSVTNVNTPEDVDITQVPGGIDDDDDDV